MQKLRVLIVDDDREVCEVLASQLEEGGYEAHWLTDPTQVVGQLKQTSYHILILDLLMPRLPGVELLQQIRSVDSDLAIIILTGHPDVDTASKAIGHGASAYLQKPISRDELIQSLSEVARRKGLKIPDEHDLLSEMGKRIRAIRKGRSMTLKKLAAQTGLSVSMISQIERAESSPSIGSLFRIAQELGVKLSYLFGANAE